MQKLSNEQPDPFEKLVTNLSSSHGLWKNGIFSKVDLPKNAPIEKVVGLAFSVNKSNKDQLTNYSIEQIKQIIIPPDNSAEDAYTAVLINCGSGKEILLLQFVDETTGWWSRIYDVDSL